jgi:hypothetical protein
MSKKQARFGWLDMPELTPMDAMMKDGVFWK